MEIEWIEDFLCLADTRSFSRAAVNRHSSQPAFSRRIQALETWLGVELVNRESVPPALTPAGRAFHGLAESTVRQLYQARDLLQGKKQATDKTVRFGVAYTLALTFFPDWFAQLQHSFGSTQAIVSEMNGIEGAEALIEGEVDFMIGYHHPRIPVPLDAERHPYLTLARESFRPYSACDEAGRPLHLLPGTREQPVPFLTYTSGTFLVHVVNMILLNAPAPCSLQQRYQSQMSEAVKAMVVAGNGVGWLPEQCVAKEVREGRVLAAGDDSWSTELEIRVYRSSGNRHPAVENLWRHLQQRPFTNP